MHQNENARVRAAIHGQDPAAPERGRVRPHPSPHPAPIGGREARRHARLGLRRLLRQRLRRAPQRHREPPRNVNVHQLSQHRSIG